MSNFDKFIDRVLKSEGGYVHHAADPGGKTMYGITEAVARRHGYTGAMHMLPLETAKAIYRADYWNRVYGDSLPPSVAFHALDAAVNHGPGQAIRWLQRAAGAADDGQMGPVTLAKVKDMAAVDVVLLFNAERLHFYTKLSTWSSFGKGWVRRCAENLRYSAEDL